MAYEWGRGMDKHYYLHRISHEDYVSYGLLNDGFLTIGWEFFSDKDVLTAAREGDIDKFNKITAGCARSRWSMWYFAKMNVGDTIVVPLYGGKFSAFRVVEVAKSVSELEKEVPNIKVAWGNNILTWKDNRIYDGTDSHCVDIGFFVKVEPIVENVQRSYVGSRFVSRMKIRTTTADITDIKDNVEEGIEAGKNNKPITLYEKTIDNLISQVKTSIVEVLDDNQFEKLIKWYFEKCGASSVCITAKNEAGKVDGADADVIAEFENLKHIVYVQAKHHVGTTDEWAVHQVDNYKKQKSEGDYDYTYATWVITAADSFTEKAKEYAEQNKVRLIDGNEFAQMLIDIGLVDVDKAFGI